MTIKVGDKVRLRAFTDTETLFFADEMKALVGAVATVTEVDEIDPSVCANDFWWPLAAVELVSSRPSGPRRIALTLASDATDAECGCCEWLAGRSLCLLFQKSLSNQTRLPECIAAEVR